MTEVSIRNMVCPRCISSVEAIFHHAGTGAAEVSLGKVRLPQPLSPTDEEKVRQALLDAGFEWLDDPRLQLVSQVKNEITALVQSGTLDEMNDTLSVYLSRKLLRDYHTLSVLFSSMEGTTIEQYFILQKIEKVKEWIQYKEYTLSEMAIRLGYSSVAHLSSQFRKVTGMTPSAFGQSGTEARRPIDGL
ncbi:MAG: helix-turn-helix domain-containing protein [Chitinophagaceae bacterium]|nr:MAG: helix-turn-helix domain-containing protein [Chitinophagaceae bacterium]